MTDIHSFHPILPPSPPCPLPFESSPIPLSRPSFHFPALLFHSNPPRHPLPTLHVCSAVKRKTHKERAQPAGRKKLGLLEKKKDYKLRANDYQSKKKRLEALRLKAEMRNVDEFYFGMAKHHTKNGVHVSGAVGVEKEANPTADVLKLIRTQNKGYLEMHLAHERAQVERLQQSLHFIGAGKGTHTVFVDEDEQAQSFDPVEYFETTRELVNVPHNRLKQEQLQDLALDGGLGRSAVKASERAYGKLNNSLKRVDALQASVDHLDMKKKLLSKGKRFKIKDAEGDRPATYRWKNERKR